MDKATNKTLQASVSTVHMGLDGYVWWIGTVEDRMDPLMLGRVRVRIQAWDTEDKALIPTEDLSWAHVVHPVNGTHGNVVPPKEGTVVMGFFMDGKEAQFPVVTGIIHGIPEAQPDAAKGFSDPGKLENRPTLPETEASRYPRSEFLNEPHTPRLARAEKTDELTYIKKRKEDLVEITNAKGETWKEPTPPYAAKYPYNIVEVTESGHTFEKDDTVGAERINTHHRSGTYREMQPDGSEVTHIYGNDYQITIKNKNIYVKGDYNLNVDGNMNLKVAGDVKWVVDGRVDWEVGKGMAISVGEELQVTNGSEFTHESSGSMTWNGPKYTFV